MSNLHPPPYTRQDPHPRCFSRVRRYWWVAALAVIAIVLVPVLVIFVRVQDQVQGQVQSAINDGNLQLNAWTLTNATNSTGFQLSLSTQWRTQNPRTPTLQAFSTNCAVGCISLINRPSAVHFPQFTAANGMHLDLSLYIADPPPSTHTVEYCFLDFIVKGYTEQFICDQKTVAYTVAEEGLPSYAVNLKLEYLDLAGVHGQINFL